MTSSKQHKSDSGGLSGAGPVAEAWAFISAARSADGKLRSYYAAEARNLIGGIRSELAVLELNLGHVEQALTKEGTGTDG